MVDLAQWAQRVAADGAEELRLQTGQPLSVRAAGTVRPLADETLDTAAVIAALGSVGLTALIPEGDHTGTPTAVSVGEVPCTVTAARHGDYVQVRIRIEAPAVALDRPRTVETGSAATAMAGPPTRAPAADPAADPAAESPQAREPSSRPQPVEAASPSVGGDAVKFVPRGQATLRSLRVVRESAGDRIELAVPVKVERRLGELLRQARECAASDVHVSAGRPAMIRCVGQLVPVGAPIEPADLELALRPLLTDAQRDAIDRVGHVDLAVQAEDIGRLRVNVSRQRGGVKVCLRMIDDAPRTLEELALPPELHKVSRYHQGLVVVSGPSGQGKTTTMAALVDRLNTEKPDHIVTVEDPIEILHSRKRAVISQREVGTHTQSFQVALKGALREDPDVIIIGELRDKETVEMALSAAETGHLVIATMSTPNGAKTIDRLIDLFPPQDQSQVRSTLAGALKMVISQRLVPAADGSRRHAAAELITGNVPLWSLIRDDKLYQLPSLLQRGRGYGMIRVEDSLKELLDGGAIDRETARRFADDPRVFEEKPAASARDEAPAERSGLQELVGNIFGRKS